MTHIMGKFAGTEFYTKKGGIKTSDTVYVVSSHGAGTEPFLEGAFKVSETEDGTFKHNDHIFKQKSYLSVLRFPESPISLSFLQDRLSPKKFASRFMNFKPNLEDYEISEFDDLLLKANSKKEAFKSAEPQLISDLENILQTETECTREVLCRIGQGAFRRNVAEVWGLDNEVCVVTGIALPAILTASHIVPWHQCTGTKVAMRLDGANGILVCANIDRLFDRYLLTFVKKGSSCVVKYSKSLDGDYLKQLQMTEDLELVPNSMSKSDKERFFSNIQEHNNEFYKREAGR
jgi:hypothetical protein